MGYSQERADESHESRYCILINAAWKHGRLLGQPLLSEILHSLKGCVEEPAKDDVVVILKRNDALQIADSLAARAEQYRVTQQYHEASRIVTLSPETRLPEWLEKLAESIRKQVG